jgi:hypothetical protein
MLANAKAIAQAAVTVERLARGWYLMPRAAFGGRTPPWNVVFIKRPLLGMNYLLLCVAKRQISHCNCSADPSLS